MTSRLRTTTPSTHVLDAIDLLISHGVSGLPVIDLDGQFAGRFSERTAISALDLADVTSSRTDSPLHSVRASDLMQDGILLRSSIDTFSAVSLLLDSRSSGAPVVDDLGNLLGVFSEKSAMRVFIGLCWEQLPSSRVTAWLDRDEGRRITEETRLDEILDRFQQSEFRRLMVVRGGQLVGEVNRRVALKAAAERVHGPLINVTRDVPDSVKTVDGWSGRFQQLARWPMF